MHNALHYYCVLSLWFTVQQGQSLREKALPESAGAEAEPPERPARLDSGEQSIIRVRGVFDDACHPAQT